MIRRVARRSIKRFDVSCIPADDAGYTHTLFLRRDRWKAAVPGKNVPGVWITIDRALGVDDIWDMIWYYIKYFEQQSWERGVRCWDCT